MDRGTKRRANGLRGTSPSPCRTPRYCSDDPYSRLGPVHSCLYVRVRETGAWELFRDFIKSRNTTVETWWAQEKSDWASSMRKMKKPKKNWKNKCFQQKFSNVRDWFRVSRSACRAPGPLDRARAKTSGVDQWVLKWRELEFPGFARVVDQGNPRILDVPITSFQWNLYPHWESFWSGFQTETETGFVPVTVNVCSDNLWRSQNVTISNLWHRSHTLNFLLFSNTDLVTFWSQMSQMVTHSNVTGANLFLFLFSKEMVRNVCILFGIRIRRVFITTLDHNKHWSGLPAPEQEKKT